MHVILSLANTNEDKVGHGMHLAFILLRKLFNVKFTHLFTSFGYILSIFLTVTSTATCTVGIVYDFMDFICIILLLYSRLWN